MRTRTLSFALTALALVIAWPALAWAAGDPAACESGGFLAKGWVWAFLGVFGAGFLTSLTPCVYPMIPIVVGVFGARDEEVTRAKAFMLATMYVLGMGVMYAALGVVFALIGKQFGTILADPWVVIPLVAFYVALAASMFGAFEINLPQSWQNKLNTVGGKGYGGAFGMGLVGGLTAAPCTGPILAGILTWVAQTKNVVAGSTLLFTYAIGMGVLFWIIAAFTVSLPKSGRWMDSVKSFGGIALLAVAVYFLRPILPVIEQLGSGASKNALGIGAILLTIGGIALGAIHLSFSGSWAHRIRKGLGVIVTIIGITAGINYLLTPDRYLQWVKGNEPNAEQTAFARAKAEGKGVMIDFAANWCAPCKELEHTFADPEVYDAITTDFVPLKFDVSKGTDQDEERQTRYGALTLPAVIFVDANGNELGRVSQYVGPAPFLKVLKPAAAVVKGQGPVQGADPCVADAVGAAPVPPVADRPTAVARVRSTPAPVTAANAASTPAAGVASATTTASDTAVQALATPAQGTPAQEDLEKAGAESASESGSAGDGQPIAWLDDEVPAFVEAEFNGRAVLIDFYADWCGPCKQMEKTFADQRVADAINAKYIPVRLDVSSMNEKHRAKMEAFGVEKLPALIALAGDGEEWVRITDYKPPAELLKILP